MSLHLVITEIYIVFNQRLPSFEKNSSQNLCQIHVYLTLNQDQSANACYFTTVIQN